MRYLARSFEGARLYGSDALSSSTVDQWLDSTLTSVIDAKELNTYLELNTFIVGRVLSLADIAVWGSLKSKH